MLFCLCIITHLLLDIITSQKCIIEVYVVMNILFLSLSVGLKSILDRQSIEMYTIQWTFYLRSNTYGCKAHAQNVETHPQPNHMSVST